MPTSMVLRFRDLISETIKEHNDIISSCEKVWWGWWNKPNEKIPRMIFAEFKGKIKKDGFLKIFLIDSGTNTLYEAELIEIYEAETEEPIKTPDEKLTPQYYSYSKYKAWFCFKKINRIDSIEIKNWSYDEVKEFLIDPHSNIFQDKIVFSTEEMLSRIHRTIYFIQPFKKGTHKEIEIKLVPPHEHLDFSIVPILCKSNYIIHLSDLHFGEKHGFKTETTAVHTALADQIISDLENLHKGKKLSTEYPAVILITGDLTSGGTKSEFEQAQKFLDYLRTKFSIERENIIIVPGNHDILWLDSSINSDRISEISGEQEVNYRDFYINTLGHKYNKYLCMGRRYIFSNLLAVDILGINSCRLENKNFAGHGFIGSDQLQHALSNMKWNDDKFVKLRICALHHHLVPIDTVEKIDSADRIYNLTLDSASITYELHKNKVDLVLHGHRHQPSVTAVTKHPNDKKGTMSKSNLTIINGGSAGAERKYLGAIGKNSYCIFETNRDNVRILRRSSADITKGFEDSGIMEFEYNPEGGLKPG